MDGIGYWLGLAVSTLLGVAGVRTEETPSYRVIVSDGECEVREYGPRLVVETRVDGPREEASREAFGRLAGYIFGANRGSRKVAMTAPVTMEAAPEKVAMTAPVTMDALDGGMLMRFFVPGDYDASTAPRPTDERVELRELPGETVAVIRFSGRLFVHSTDKEKALREWIAARGYEPQGAATLAGYDSPYVLPILRRNEVIIPIRAPVTGSP